MNFYYWNLRLKTHSTGLLQFIVPIVKLNFSRRTNFAHFDMQIFDSKIVFRKNHVVLLLVIRELWTAVVR